MFRHMYVQAGTKVPDNSWNLAQSRRDLIQSILFAHAHVVSKAHSLNTTVGFLVNAVLFNSGFWVSQGKCVGLTNSTSFLKIDYKEVH